MSYPPDDDPEPLRVTLPSGWRLELHRRSDAVTEEPVPALRVCGGDGTSLCLGVINEEALCGLRDLIDQALLERRFWYADAFIAVCPDIPGTHLCAATQTPKADEASLCGARPSEGQEWALRPFDADGIAATRNDGYWPLCDTCIQRHQESAP